MSTGPSNAELHYSQPLSDFSVAAHGESTLIAKDLFPVVPVDKQFDRYWTFDKASWLRSYDTKRVDGTESKGAGWTQSTDAYACDLHAFHKDITDSDYANDDHGSLEQDASEFTTGVLLRSQEKALVSTALKPGVWGVDLDGAASADSNSVVYWSSEDSDPILEIQRRSVTMGRNSGGFRPNTLVLGEDVEVALLNHPAILDRIKYTERGVVTRDLLASLFGVQKILVPSAIENIAAEGEDAEYASIHNPKSVLLAHVAPKAGKKVRTAGVTFVWKGRAGSTESGLGGKVSKFRMEHLKSERVECEMAYDFKVIDNSLGVYFHNVVQ